MKKPILCLDFDGVIHSYASGWKGADVIPDPPVEGAMQFICDALDHFDVHVYSSRSGQDGGILAMQMYLKCHIEELLDCDPTVAIAIACLSVKWPTEKPPAMVSIDDRAITFTGTWPSMDALRSFRPWNKH